MDTSNAEGASAPCPNCGAGNIAGGRFCSQCGRDLLPLVVEPVSAATPSKDPRLIGAILFILFAICFVIYMYHISADPAAPSAATLEASLAAPHSIHSEPAPLVDRLHVKQWSLVKAVGESEETAYEVSGVVENTSSQNVSTVFLTVALFDPKGNIVATSTVDANNVPAGGTAFIHGYVIDNTNTRHPKGQIEVSQAD